VPLAVVISATNIHDSSAFEDLVDAVAAIEADRSYDPKAPADNKKALWCTERRGEVTDRWNVFSEVSNLVIKLPRKAWIPYH